MYMYKMLLECATNIFLITLVLCLYKYKYKYTNITMLLNI